MSFDPIKPYNALPLLPPKAELETRDVLRKAIAANKALAELKGAGDLIPNQAILINSIPLQEARYSSEIENIVTTNDALFRAAAVESSATDPATKEVLRYRAALNHGYEQLAKRPLSTRLMIELCSILLNADMDVRKIPGTVVANPATGKVLYTPPVGEKIIRDKLSNLEKFIHASNDMDPLVRMAVAHYQFEAIHPFSDGNGRTGRILNLLFLVERHLLKIPVLYLSRYIIRHKNDYYRLLREVTADAAWEAWLLYMLAAVEEMALWTRDRVLAIRSLLEETAALSRKKLPSRIYSRELIDTVFYQPYCKIGFLVEAGIAERKTAAVYLQRLEDIGVLKSVKAGRERIFLNPKLLNLLRGQEK